MVIVVIHKITLHLNGLFQFNAILSDVVKENPTLRSLGAVGGTELIPVATYLEKAWVHHALKSNACKNPQHTCRVLCL